MTHDVFLSYSSTDAQIAAEVCAALEDSGMAKRDMVGGNGAAIIRAIRASKIDNLYLSHRERTSF